MSLFSLVDKGDGLSRGSTRQLITSERTNVSVRMIESEWEDEQHHFLQGRSKNKICPTVSSVFSNETLSR